MILARVVGSVVSTHKTETIEGIKFLLLEKVKIPSLEGTGDFVVAMDSVGAGIGEIVFYVSGSSARMTETTKGKPADATIVGIVDKDSFLGRFYQKKDSIFYKYATFFGAREVRKMLEEAGFSKACFYQTLFKLPQYINSIESPLRGYGKGGFVVISAQK